MDMATAVRRMQLAFGVAALYGQLDMTGRFQWETALLGQTIDTY